MAKGRPTPICPSCGSIAVGRQPHPGGPARMACAHCGYAAVKGEFTAHAERPEGIGNSDYHIASHWRDEIERPE